MHARVKHTKTVAVTLADGREIELHIHTGHTAKRAEANFDQAVRDAAEIVAAINAGHEALATARHVNGPRHPDESGVMDDRYMRGEF